MWNGKYDSVEENVKPKGSTSKNIPSKSTVTVKSRPQFLSTVTGRPVVVPNKKIKSKSEPPKTKEQLRIEEKKKLAMEADDGLVESVQQFVEGEEPSPLTMKQRKKLLMREAEESSIDTGEDRMDIYHRLLSALKAELKDIEAMAALNGQVQSDAPPEVLPVVSNSTKPLPQSASKSSGSAPESYAPANKPKSDGPVDHSNKKVEALMREAAKRSKETGQDKVKIYLQLRKQMSLKQMLESTNSKIEPEAKTGNQMPKDASLLSKRKDIPLQLEKVSSEKPSESGNPENWYAKKVAHISENTGIPLAQVHVLYLIVMKIASESACNTALIQHVKRRFNDELNVSDNC